MPPAISMEPGPQTKKLEHAEDTASSQVTEETEANAEERPPSNATDDEDIRSFVLKSGAALDFPFEIGEIVWIVKPGYRAPLGEFRIIKALPHDKFELVSYVTGDKHPEAVEGSLLHKMVNVAIAGGSHSIGRAIASALEADGSHKYVILSRTESDDPKVVTVDYSDVEKLAETLDSHEIHTVISALSLQSDASGRAQMNLIEAATRSHHTKRFMPSEFGANYTQKFIKGLPLYAWKLKAADLLEESNLEYTRISNGIFLDYWFAPHIKSAFAVNVPTWVDVENNYAVIPGDGNAPLVVTHSRDIARFAVAVLGLPCWEKRYFLVGDQLTINDFVCLAEEVKGVEFEKHTNDAETLAQGGCTFVPAARGLLQALEDHDQLSMGRMLAFIGTLIVDGDMDLPAEPNLNKLFPDLKMLTVREALEISFGK